MNSISEVTRRAIADSITISKRHWSGRLQEAEFLGRLFDLDIPVLLIIQLDKSRSYPYLYLDATYLKARWAGAVRDVALLVAVGVNDEGFREVLAVEAAAGERSETWRGLLQGLVGRGLRGVELVISDDHDAIKNAVQIELSGVGAAAVHVHFQRNNSPTSHRPSRRRSPQTSRSSSRPPVARRLSSSRPASSSDTQRSTRRLSSAGARPDEALTRNPFN